jgi:16S rRNA (cytosine967-C5)-methyltransferase
MRDGGRVSAAIEVLAEIEARHFPVRMALKRWGESARYAGSKDRAFVSGLVLDALRRKRSLGWMMGDASPRAVVIGVLAHVWQWTPERIAEAAAEEHGFGALSETEQQRLSDPVPLSGAAAPVAGDYLDWLEPHLTRVFGEAVRDEMAALSDRAPVDLRINTLKTDLERGAKAVALIGGAPAGQLAAAVAGEIKGKQVLDFCAGGGGKTLALAAAMNNSGQIFAHDSDARRLADTIRRSQRAGVRNLQIRSPVEAEPLKGMDGRMDVVFVDAPCTGSGTWRRHPDAKWRLSEDQLGKRIAEQDLVLDQAAPFVKPGGRLVYVTCSVFAEENEDRIAAFLARNPAFAARPITLAPVADHITPEGFLRLTPHTAGADGFFVALLERTA